MPIAAAPVIDPYDLMEAVNVLGQLPKDFYDKIVRNNNYINNYYVYMCIL